MLASQKQITLLQNLFLGGALLSYKKGEYIIRPGEEPNGVYYIEEGLVKAYSITKYGEENLLIIRKGHEIFPLIWAITGQERHIVYQALCPTSLRRIPFETYNNFLTTHPDALPPVIDMITEMYRLHSERILTLEYRSVRERLVSFLLTMNERFGEAAPDGMLINVPLRHQDIASSINASRETTSRELAGFERKKLITNRQLYITLKDIPKLQDHL